jgi:hypothetical protein
MSAKLFSAVNSVKLNEFKVSSLKFSSIKLGSSASNKPRQGQGIFPLSSCIQTGSGAHAASYQMGAGGPFPGSKARPGYDADHSPPSSAEVVNE